MLNRGSCDARLHKAHHVLHVISTHPHIAQLFGLTGAHADQLDHGWTLYHRTLDATADRIKQNGQAIHAQTRCTQTFQSARAAQGRITALARLIITAPADQDRLAISGRRADAVGAWRCQAELFHANLTQADRILLTRVGVHAAELDQAAALLTQLAQDHAACVAAKARARAATSTKTHAFQELAAYLSLLIGMARVLEPDHPYLLPMLQMKPDARRRPASPTSDPLPEPPQPVQEPQNPKPNLHPQTMPNQTVAKPHAPPRRSTKATSKRRQRRKR